MLKLLFRKAFGIVDIVAIGIITLIETDYKNPLIFLLFIPWVAISGAIEQKLVKDKK